jgi:hypothetical protein
MSVILQTDVKKVIASPYQLVDPSKPFDALPPEVIALIFEWLSDPKDWIRAGSVCKEWHTLLDEEKSPQALLQLQKINFVFHASIVFTWAENSQFLHLRFCKLTSNAAVIGVVNGKGRYLRACCIER